MGITERRLAQQLGFSPEFHGGWPGGALGLDEDDQRAVYSPFSSQHEKARQHALNMRSQQAVAQAAAYATPKPQVISGTCGDCDHWDPDGMCVRMSPWITGSWWRGRGRWEAVYMQPDEGCTRFRSAGHSHFNGMLRDYGVENG